MTAIKNQTNPNSFWNTKANNDDNKYIFEENNAF